MTTYTVGTSGRNYATVALADAAVPSTLADAYTLSLYNDSEFGASSVGSHTTTATYTYTVTAAAGQSFMDQAGVRTNALRYNISNGVGIKVTAGYTNGLTSNGMDYIYFSRLQVKNTGNSGGCEVIQMSQSPCHGTIQNCLAEKSNSGGSLGTAVYVAGGNLIVSNLQVVWDVGGNPSGTQGAFRMEGTKAVGCAVIRPTNRTAGGVGYGYNYSGAILESCAAFGFTTPANAAFSSSSKNNATEQSAFGVGSSNQVSITYNSTTPFTSATYSSFNGIPVTGTNLTANGYRESGIAPNDISGTARAASPTIGVWELASGGSSVLSGISFLSLLGVG